MMYLANIRSESLLLLVQGIWQCSYSLAGCYYMVVLCLLKLKFLQAECYVHFLTAVRTFPTIQGD